MKSLLAYLRELVRGGTAGWNRFWFTPADPATLGLVRILAGAMLLYTHLVWSLDLEGFFGPRAWLDARAVRAFYGALAGDDGAGQGGDDARNAERGTRNGPQPSTLNPQPSYAWSYFYYLDSPAALWTAHIAALAVFALLTLGLATRPVSILAFLAAVSYANRAPGALFGLDQINLMLAMYLAVGPSGAAYSLDRLIAQRRAGGVTGMTKDEARMTNDSRRAGGVSPLITPRTSTAGAGQGGVAPPSVGANIAIRLIQVHMCVIYFFAAIGKLQGAAWHDGTALWLAFANLEYQSLDMTWTAHWPLLVNLLTHVTLYWELFFSVLIWPRLTRPLVLALALPLHLGIGACLGMPTFGLVMLIGCLAFVPPGVVRSVLRLGRGAPRPTADTARDARGNEPARRTATARRG